MLAHFHPAEHSEIDVPAANHREALRAVEKRRGRQLADRLLAGVDQIGIDLVVIGERPDAEHPVLALQRDGHLGRHMIGDQGGDADAEVDVEAVLQLFCRSRGHLVPGPALGFHLRGHHAASLSRTVRNSIFLS